MIVCRWQMSWGPSVVETRLSDGSTIITCRNITRTRLQISATRQAGWAGPASVRWMVVGGVWGIDARVSECAVSNKMQVEVLGLAGARDSIEYVSCVSA